MDYVSEFFNMIDIYGLTFNFTTFKKDKFTSLIGGFLTTITGSMFLVLFIMFGMPVFLKLNPNVIIQSLDLDTYPLYNVSNQNYPLAFRFENEKKIAIDLDGYLYPFLQHIKQQKNNVTGNMDTYNMSYFSFKQCDKEMFKDHSTELEGWYCVNWNEFNNLTIGGLYDARNTFVNYFKITIFYCKFDGTNYSNCTDYDKLNSLLNGKVKIYFSMMVPEVSISPTTPDNPLSVVLTNYFFTLNPLLMRTDRYYHRRVNAKQDLGWIFEDYSFYEGFSLERRDTDIQMRTVDDYNNPSKIKTIATAVYYITNKVNEIQVNFMKIQNVLASVGGVLQIFQMLFSFTMYFLNFHLRYFYIVNDMFYFEFEKTNKKNQSASMDQSQLSNIKGVSLDNASNLAMISVNERLPIFNNYVSAYDKKLNFNDSKLTKNVLEINNQNIEGNFEALDLKKDNFIRKNIKSHQIPMSTITTKKITACCNDSKNIKYKIYIYAEEILKERLDILYYLKFISKMENFMSLFLNKQQRRALKYFKNEKLNFDNVNENTHQFISSLFHDNFNEDEINKIINYFKEKAKTNSLNQIDTKLLKELMKK